jgi:hypothetical protein
MAIVREIAKHGKCTYSHLASSLTHLGDIESDFNTLVEQNFIAQVADTDMFPPMDRILAAEAEELAKNPHMSANEKAKMKRNVAAGIAEWGESTFEDKPVGAKRKIVYAFDEGNNKVYSSHCFQVFKFH